MLKCFVSYSQHNLDCVKDLNKWLTLLKQDGTLSLWDDRDLVPGENWDKSIRSKIKKADIIFLMLTQEFFNTLYVMQDELSAAIKREKLGQCRIIPIILYPCTYQEHKFISSLSIIPRKAKPIYSLETKAKQDEAWNEVFGIIKSVIKIPIQNDINIFLDKEQETLSKPDMPFYDTKFSLDDLVKVIKDSFWKKNPNFTKNSLDDYELESMTKLYWKKKLQKYLS